LDDEHPISKSQPVEIDETAMFGDSFADESDGARSTLLPGNTFGRYRIDRVLGEGAMGHVYQAQDSQLSRKVALKIPKINAQEDSKFIVRFLREARSAATLSHPNICPVYDVGEIDSTHFITMAYIQGHPLSEFVNSEKPQRDRTVANVVRRIALALNEAHINGLIHRDVKPANVMIDHRNEPIIMDFGLARAIDGGDDARLTKDGAILGSPAYMSPEQIEGNDAKIGPGCDIYSLGVILYELLTGQLPFQGSVVSIIGQIVTSPPKNPCDLRADISPKLAKICLKAMSKKIEDRYSSMKEFADALMDFLKSPDAAAKLVRTKQQKTSDKKKKESGIETNEGLRLTAPMLEATCSCGQRLQANRRLAGKMVKCPRCNNLVTLPEGNPAALPPAISVACDGCGQRFMARTNLIGKVVKCTMCGRPLLVQRPGTQPRIERQIDVRCGCGQQFLARESLAGKRVKCTACGKPLTIPK
jgi:serine/threonine protein kinase